MRWNNLWLTSLFVVTGTVHAGEQEPAERRFEVASVKPSSSTGPRAPSGGGPGTSDPERIRYGRATLAGLLSIAYGIDRDQIQGPQWIGVDMFNIDAKVPSGATKDDVPLMLRSLLRERFHVIVHTETAKFAGYELVLAKSGPKIKNSTSASSASGGAENGEGQPISRTKDASGFPVLGPGIHYQSAYSNGVEQASFRDISLAEFVKTLRFDGAQSLGGSLLSRPQIVERTGLIGNYDFTLEFRRKLDDPNSDGPDLFSALEKQLGLRLQKAELFLPVLIIDKAERTPAEN